MSSGRAGGRSDGRAGGREGAGTGARAARRLVAALLATVLVPAVAACSDSGDSGPDTHGDSFPDDGTASDSSVLGAELAGRWAHYDVVAYADPAMNTLIISYGFTDFEVRDGQLWEQESFCFAEQKSNLDITTSISDEATSAITPVATPVEVTETPEGELRVQRPATPTPIGIDLEDPANEPLPTDPGDPRITDDDGDGKPGVTVTVEAPGFTGELWIARREVFAYDMVTEGRPDGTPDTMAGHVIDDSEQLVIGASSEALATPTAWVQSPDPALSPIILERVESDWDCERLRADRDTLFPPSPSADF